MATRSVFSRVLKSAREAAGFKVPELAEVTGLSIAHIYFLESGKRQPSWEAVQLLAAALGCDVHAFIDPRLTAAGHRRRIKGKP